MVGFGPGQVPTFLHRAAHSGVLPSCMGKMVPCPAIQSDFGGLMPRVCMVRGFLEETHRILCLDRRPRRQWPLSRLEGFPGAPIKGTNGFPPDVLQPMDDSLYSPQECYWG